MKFFKNIRFTFFVAIAALVIAGCGDSIDTSKKMDGETLSKIQADNKEKEKILLIDVRSKEEYDAGHLKHAINIPFAELESRMDELEPYKNKDIVFYCNTGNQSGKAVDLLKDKGFKSLTNADGVKEYNYDLYTFGSIAAQEFLKLNHDDILIIDVREAKDFEKGHIKGAINIPHGESLENYKDILEANKNKKIVTHCYTGNRSASLADKLSKQGFKNVNNLLDGTKEYDFKLVK
ncbi:rhodanese-like domain-containing protein [Campylobacter sp. FMV-PI01]|uniref:Rhodanese-like domain-containing protein n=1 Tax=Campylobacter portucalensis TaxID=2608384 RepID=A0A6L5WGF0_9BACT|nr:rhodanese-like domain-containing protein [Campylobacter portucalensis]MSN96039.1 rhodanese-like domain-containing protein [Campylobacter portucalensis]